MFRASFQRRVSRRVILLLLVLSMMAWGFCVRGELLDCIQARLDGDAVRLLLTSDHDGEVCIAIGDNVITFAVQDYEELDTGRLRISGTVVEIDLFAGNVLTDQCTIDVDRLFEEYQEFCCSSEDTELSIEIPAILSEEIEWTDEDHIYWFYVYEESVVTFDVDAEQYGSSLDAILELYDEYGTSLDYSDDWDGADPYLEAYLSPGLYYVVVGGYSGESIGWYELLIDWISGGVGGATSVEIPAQLSNAIETIEEADTYSFYVYEESVVMFDVDAEQYGSSLDAVLELYDEYGTSLDYNDDSGGHDPFLTVLLWPGLYYLEVKGYTSSSIGWYELAITEARPTYVEIPVSFYDVLGEYGESHAVSFYVYAEGSVTFDVDAAEYGSDLDAVLELYDEYGIFLDYSDDWDGSDPYLEAYLLPGLYYVVVGGYSGGSIGWYELRIQ